MIQVTIFSHFLSKAETFIAFESYVFLRSYSFANYISSSNVNFVNFNFKFVKIVIFHDLNFARYFPIQKLFRCVFFSLSSLF